MICDVMHLWRHAPTDLRTLSKYAEHYLFIFPLVQSAKIRQETRNLQSKTKWHVFYGARTVYIWVLGFVWGARECEMLTR